MYIATSYINRTFCSSEISVKFKWFDSLFDCKILFCFVNLVICFRCPYCTVYYWDSHELSKHRSKHSDVEYKCEVCERIYLNRDALHHHCTTRHGKRFQVDPNEEYICDICSKHFKTKSGIKNHLFLHTSESFSTSKRKIQKYSSAIICDSREIRPHL